MDGVWYRVGVYFGLREDPDAEVRRNAERPDLVTSLLGVALLVLASAVFFCVLTLVVRLVFGGDTSAHGVAVGGLRFFGLTLTILLIGAGAGRWLYWFADRRIRKG